MEVDEDADDPGGSYDFMIEGSFESGDWESLDGENNVRHDGDEGGLIFDGSVDTGFPAPGWDAVKVESDLSTNDIKVHNWWLGGIDDGVIVTVDSEEY